MVIIVLVLISAILVGLLTITLIIIELSTASNYENELKRANLPPTLVPLNFLYKDLEK